MLRCVGALWVRTIPSLLAAFLTSPSVWAFNITTHHYNALRTGWNKHETILNSEQPRIVELRHGRLRGARRAG